MDGVCSGIIQCPTAEECTDWLQAIASNISVLTKHNVRISAAFLYETSIKFQVSCSGTAGIEYPDDSTLKWIKLNFLPFI